MGLDDTNELVVGEAASELRLRDPGRYVAAFKRQMGTAHRFQIGGRTFRPEELSALVIRRLIDDVETRLGFRATEAVISVPAYFSDAQRKATKVAGELAGLHVERLINEPTAAAIAYRLHEQLDERKIIVIDLGGGTLDVSILEFFEGVMQVRATTGDNFLGGEDFDARLRDHVLAAKSLAADELLLERVALERHARNARHELSTKTDVEIEFEVGGRFRRATHSLRVSRAELEQACEPLLLRVRRTIERALKDSRMAIAELDDIVLVGGATRMPMIRNLVGRLFRRLPMSHIGPDEAIALGAAAQAGMKQRDAALRDIVLTDVCPYTLGIEVAVDRGPDSYEPGHFLPVIDRNTPVPISRVKQIAPIAASQRVVECRIFQGESRLTKNNIELGRLTVHLPPTGPREVDVRFSYDVNGILLEVDTQVVGTELRRNLVIVNSRESLTDEQVQESIRKLSTLKVHPRDKVENRAALARAEQIYEESLAETRDQIGNVIRRFEDALATQDEERIGPARTELMEILDALDRDAFR